MLSRDSKVHNFTRCLFLLIIIRSGRLAQIRWSVCRTKFLRSLCYRNSPGQKLGCEYTICLNGQISVSWIIPSGLPCPPICVSFYTLSVLMCCFADYVIDCFVSITTSFTSSVLLYRIYSCYDMICTYIIFCASIRRVRFSLKASLS